MDITGDKAWANAHAAEFGLHFPIPGEDWHVEMIDDDGSRGHVHGAQGAGAIGFDVNWMESPGGATARRDEMLQSYVDVITQSQQDALLSSPAGDPMLASPAPDMSVVPDMSVEGASQLAVPEQRDATAMTGGPQGQPGPAVAGAGGEDQLANARLIAQVGRQMGMPDEAIQIALAAALVESNLRNVNYGDRDSLGLFQQRPSQGWGTPQQVMDPAYAARKFFEGLSKVNWQSMGFDAAQAVQRSAYPDRYRERSGEARSIFAQIAGSF
jgi:hypothetical protein